MNLGIINLLDGYSYTIKNIHGNLYIKIFQCDLLQIMHRYPHFSLVDCFVVKKTTIYEIYYQLQTANNIFFIYFSFDKLELPSICSIFPNANWYEREIFDMYKISFTNHPNLKSLFN